MGRVHSPAGGDASVRASLALFLFSLVSAGALISADPEKHTDITFKVDVSLVNLLVTVKDPRGAPVADLEAANFTITDTGKAREIAVFERRTNRPLSVSLMLDTSLSTAKELRFERDSAKRFFEKLLGPGSHPGDRMAVLQFAESVELLAPFTNSKKRIRKGLGNIQKGGGTSMYDAILLSSHQLRRRSGRRVMIIITDGGDTTSYTGFQEALESAHETDAVIYGIIVIPIRSDAGRNTGGENALKVLAANTGGETFVQYANENLDEAFDEILESLRTQYLIAYYPPKRASELERFRRIQVTVDRPGARVLSRNGYYLSEAPVPRAEPRRISVRPKPRPKASPPDYKPEGASEKAKPPAQPPRKEQP